MTDYSTNPAIRRVPGNYYTRWACSHCPGQTDKRHDPFAWLGQDGHKHYVCEECVRTAHEAGWPVELLHGSWLIADLAELRVAVERLQSHPDQLAFSPSARQQATAALAELAGVLAAAEEEQASEDWEDICVVDSHDEAWAASVRAAEHEELAAAGRRSGSAR